MLIAAAEPVNLLQSWIPVIGVMSIVILGVVLMISIRGRIARSNASRPSPRDQIAQIKQTGRQRDDANRYMSELLETSQRLSAMLDNKSERLEQLLDEAEERIATLLDALEEIRHEHDQESSDQRPEADDPPATVGSIGPDTGRPQPSPGLDPLTRAVYELADKGNSAVDIARQLDEQIGKVELILSLRRA